jgi:hypothetical protein
MKNEKAPGRPERPSRRTLRLTFLRSIGKLELVKQERLEMITPPQVGERPNAATHGGFWIELQDAKKRVLAHRLIDPSLLDSVAVHSPDGSIERTFGEPRDGVFEVLLPDDDNAASAVLIGIPRAVTERAARAGDPASSELARFDLPGRRKEANDEHK